MNIKKLSVENFRCIVKAEFEFNQQLNLIIGANGSGKSTLFACLKAVLAEAVQQLGNTYISGGLVASDVRIISSVHHERVRFESAFPVRLEAEGKVFDTPVSWYVERNSVAGTPDTGLSLYNLLKPKMGQLDMSEPFTLPLITFYGAQRNALVSHPTLESAATQRLSRRSAYDQWSSGSVDTSELNIWVVGKTLERLQNIAEYGKAGEERDELTIVNRALTNCIPGMKGLKYDLRLRSMLVTFEDGSASELSKLSDGQRNIVCLLADIARRMCVLNPHLGDRVLEETDGIIAVDELDLHLHPKWQRDVLSLLKMNFPRLQYFITSHSPQMVGGLTPEEIVILVDGKPLKPETSYGLDASSVLEEVMNTPSRDPGIEGQLRQLFRSLEGNDLKMARGTLEKLRLTAPGLPEYARAEALLTRKELLRR